MNEWWIEIWVNWWEIEDDLLITIDGDVSLNPWMKMSFELALCLVYIRVDVICEMT